MNNYMKTVISGTKAWVEKFFAKKSDISDFVKKSEIPKPTKSDWNENDPESTAYIVNRPFGYGPYVLYDGMTEPFESGGTWASYSSVGEVEDRLVETTSNETLPYVLIVDDEKFNFDYRTDRTGTFTVFKNAKCELTNYKTGGTYINFTLYMNDMDPHYVKLYIDKPIGVDKKIDPWFLEGYLIGAGVGINAEVFNGNPPENASGDNAHVEGWGGTASGYQSHAEGRDTTASGENSHAEGWKTTASGESSHAEGRLTTASGFYSHAEGWNTIAGGTGAHVQGKANIEDTEDKYAHIVGNGDNNARSNAHTLDWDGNAWFAGGIELTSPNGTRYRFTVTDDGTLSSVAVTE